MPTYFAAVEWILKLTDVEDVGSWKSLGHWPDGGVVLSELVVKDQVSVVGHIVDNALMHMFCTKHS